MYSNQQQISSPEVVELRKEAGLWLKELREKRGLSQRSGHLFDLVRKERISAVRKEQTSEVGQYVRDQHL